MLQKNSSIPITKSTSGMNPVQYSPDSVWAVFSLAFIFLVFAHLCVKAFFPNPAFWLIGAGVICVVGFEFLKNRQKTFGFLLAMFVCVHFAFADNQGGLWSYVIFAVLLIVLLLRNLKTVTFASVPRGMNWLLLLFFASQCVGLVLNPFSFTSNIQSFIVACSQIMVFYACASVFLTPDRTKLLLKVWFFVASWIFFIALNQHYHWIITPSPLLPQRGIILFNIRQTPAGSFGNSELFAEYFCTIFVISLIFLINSKELSHLRIKSKFPILMLFFALGSLIMSSARSSILIAGASMVFLVADAIFIHSHWNMRRTVLLFCIIILIFVFVFAFGSYFNLDKVINDFDRLDPSEMSIDSIASGKSINRDSVYDLAYKRLNEKSWWIGYGYSIPANNRDSLGITGLMFGDYHSLYLSLPIFYGWLGAAAYILMVFYTGLRAFRCYSRNRKHHHYMAPIVFAFAFVWGIFLFDQYVVSVTRNASYFLLTWFLLGWTHAVVNSINHENHNHKVVA